MVVDYIIVGQGIAGTVMAHTLMKEQQRVVVIHNPQLPSSSKVAGGLFNPITGRKMVKTWKADELFSYFFGFYQELEHLLDAKFFYPTSIYRPFKSIEEQNEWMGKSASDEFLKYVKECHTNAAFIDFVEDKFGGLELNRCGFVDIPRMLAGYKNHLKKTGSYIEENFEEERLEFDGNGVKYGEIQAKKVIYCNGGFVKNSKYFSWLPFRLVKGETLLIETEKVLPMIFNRGVFILPKGNNMAVVGATYDWKDTSWEVTEKAKNDLVVRLKKILKVDFEIVGQKAGIRPATLDRRPFIGVHPENSRVAVFSGLGTKGVSIAPYFAKEFVKHLENNTVLDKEVNISRYFSLY